MGAVDSGGDVSLTKEQIAARRKAAREWKRRNKARRTKQGYTEKPVEQRPAVRRGRYSLPEKFWLSLKEKHKQFEGTRLEKSLKPPIFLEID